MSVNDNWQMAEMVFVLRECVDIFEKMQLTESETEVLMMAYECLRTAPHEAHMLANELEN